MIPELLPPSGFGVRLSRRTEVRDGGAMLTGRSGSVLFLSAPARGVVARLPLVLSDDPTEARVARELLDRGLAEPCWPGPPPADDAVADVTVVIPVRDRPLELARLLRSLPSGIPVVVVDDASRDPVHTPRAEVVRLDRNAGPAAARNAGLARVRTPHVAFVDSDVEPVPGWLGLLRRHLDDPAVALVAPRVLGREERVGDSWLERYEQARSSLDLGADPAVVRVHGPVSYVPGACLLGRVDALGGGFDEVMRAGEDVDLVWRLGRDGWTVRYAPEAHVRHDHRTRPAEWMRRKAFYGTSAADLAARHGDAVAPLVVAPWSLALAGALLAQRRWSLPVAALAVGAAAGGATRKLDRSAQPLRAAATLTVEGTVATVWQTASALTRHYWPAAVAVAAFSPRARRALLVAAVAEGVADYVRVRPGLDPVRYVVAHRLDDAAYGVGLWVGAARAGSVAALVPAWRGFGPIRHPFRRLRRRTSVAVGER